MEPLPPDESDAILRARISTLEREVSDLRSTLQAASYARLSAEENLRETLAAMIKHQQVGKCGNFRYNTVTGAITGTEEVFKIFGFASATTSCTVEEWITKLHPDDRFAIEHQFYDAVAEAQDLRFEYRIVTNSGGIKHIRCDGEPDVAFHGVRTYFGVLTDITDRRIAEESQRAMEADLATALRLASLGELAGSIVHEVNQPLAAIATSAAACRHWIRLGPERTDRALASLDLIIEEGGRAGAIISGLKSLIHNVSAEPAPFDLNGAAREVCAMMMRELARERISLEADFDSDLPPALGIPVQIQQIIVNLIRNAIDAMRSSERRTITISTQLSDGSISLMVRDTGHGLVDDDVQRVFAPLYTTKKDGMGLGLSISRKIAHAHGGTLEARPAGGGGAEFFLILPLEQPADD